MILNASEDAEMLCHVFTVNGNIKWHSHTKKEYHFSEGLLILCLYEIKHELSLPCNSAVSRTLFFLRENRILFTKPLI